MTHTVYPITESSDCLYCIRMRIDHRVFREIYVWNHNDCRLYFQLNIQCIVETTGKEVVFLHFGFAPLFECVFEFLIFQFFHTLLCAEYGRFIFNIQLFDKGIDHIRRVYKKTNVSCIQFVECPFQLLQYVVCMD